MGRGRWAALMLAVLAAATLAAVRAPRADPVRAGGYLTMQDGTQLRYSLTLPAETGDFPTVFTYDPYSAGRIYVTPGSGLYGTMLEAGYAVIGVNVRGTGCSGGTFDMTNAAEWGADGAEVVEWIAAQPWSDGHVGMVGSSFPGITQLAVAGQQPAHLDAITPFMVTSDFYRDIAYPGGIYDAVWMTAFGALQPYQTQAALEDGLGRLDATCATHLPLQQLRNNAVHMPQHPYIDEYWSNQPDSLVDDIEVPVLGCQAWQDGAVSSRATGIFLDRLDPARTWFIGRNGIHESCTTPENEELIVSFLEQFVGGLDHGWLPKGPDSGMPHVILRHEAEGPDTSWTSTIEDWSRAVEPTTFHLHGDGRMDLTAPDAAEANRSYDYPASQWQPYPAPAETMLAYTSDPLIDDAEFFGPGSVDLWMSSTAPDTDLQVTLSEVRTDGVEQYIQRGWLRLSHRALDQERSTVLRPYQTHLEEDASLVESGEVVFARVELRPFDHVFRAGSRIRLTIDAPAGTTDTTVGLAFLPVPAVNTIHHGLEHDSRVVLPLIPAGHAQAPLPRCGDVDGAQCRAEGA